MRKRLARVLRRWANRLAPPDYEAMNARQEWMDRRLVALLKEMRHGDPVEVKVHLTGKEVIRSVRAEKKKRGDDPPPQAVA